MNDIVKFVEQGGGLQKYLSSLKIVPPKTNTKKNITKKILDSWE